MGFYDLSKEERQELVKKIQQEIQEDLENNRIDAIYRYSSDPDTYIRKNTYLALGRIYKQDKDLRDRILDLLDHMLEEEDSKIRQTSVYAAGEIGKYDAEIIYPNLEKGLNDDDGSVRNAVVGSLKQMGQKNPGPTLQFARKHLHHADPEIRSKIVHGMELRGRTHPEDVLPLLEELQYDPDKNVRKMMIHVLGQISYKEGCLEKVITALNAWKNQEIIQKALKEILEVHKRYKFALLSPEEAQEYIELNIKT